MIQEEKIKCCIKELIDNDIEFYDYETPKGSKELRVNISKYLTKKLNININENNMIITSGTQQSLYLISRILLNNNDTIVSEEPTYFGAIEIFKELKVNILTVNINKNGIDLDELKKKIYIDKPKLIYVVPTFNNPTGISWNNSKRKKFLDIINKHNITVIEDDPYSEFNYTNYEYKSLYELNKGKNIIYLGTFSKIICPSLNVGYVLADKELIDKLYRYKLLNDMNTSAFIQKFVNLYLTKYNIEEDIINKKEKYMKNIKHIKKRLLHELKDVTFSNIQGGIFMIMYLPNIKILPSLYTKYYYNECNQKCIRIDITKPNIDKIISII